MRPFWAVRLWEWKRIAHGKRSGYTKRLSEKSHPAIFRTAPSGRGAQDAHTRVAATAKPDGFTAVTTLLGRRETIRKGFRIASNAWIAQRLGTRTRRRRLGRPMKLMRAVWRQDRS